LEGAVDGVELLWESPVLTAVLGASDVVCAPLDVEDPDGELVEAAVGELGESPGLTAVLGACDVVCAPVDVLVDVEAFRSIQDAVPR
jgi:hypothetical protein